MSTTELGTLVVVVLKARNLIDKHSFYKQDVYTKVTLHDNTQQTRVDIKGGQHPEWDDELRFPVLESKKKRAKILEIVCWSKEPRVDEIIGKGELDITETLKTGEFDGTHSIIMRSTSSFMNQYRLDSTDDNDRDSERGGVSRDDFLRRWTPSGSY